MTMLPVPSYACRAEGWRLLGDVIWQWFMARPGRSATGADRMREGRPQKDSAMAHAFKLRRAIRSR
ncbi:hypothetical protein BG36_15150 [Aquamicrobium defluvii]|uniref:Uncharacterized protein n=1 Tax=Aquamicrobium defluvii TaxID=69279 RepID=A0A011V1X0_9HYPH|nr:hypothetical protein BG36_15150 [Aquamicrobium defluvii]EZQ13136.1 hypothetical protein CF98_29535 [Halopseudomonas bauzanensis]